MLNIKNELRALRDVIENAKSELYLLRMTPMDNRVKNFSSDIKKYKINISTATRKISKILSDHKAQCKESDV